MKEKLRVAVFSDLDRARHVVEEARRAGFRKAYILHDTSAENLAESKLALPEALSQITARSVPVEVRWLPILGAVAGLVAGLVARSYVLPSLPVAGWFFAATGIVFGGLVGAFLSRGFTTEAENFFDQELQEDEVLVVIEDDDPARLQQAEKILAGAGATPIPLPRG